MPSKGINLAPRGTDMQSWHGSQPPGHALWMVSPLLPFLGQVQSGSSPSLISDHEKDLELRESNIDKNAQFHHIAVLQGGEQYNGPYKRSRALGQSTMCKGSLPNHLQPAPVHLIRGEEICPGRAWKEDHWMILWGCQQAPQHWTH